MYNAYMYMYMYIVNGGTTDYLHDVIYRMIKTHNRTICLPSSNMDEMRHMVTNYQMEGFNEYPATDIHSQF